MLLKNVHVFTCIQAQGNHRLLTLAEHDFNIHGKVANCRIEYVPGLLEVSGILHCLHYSYELRHVLHQRLRIVCRNEASCEFCTFLTIDGQAAERPVHVRGKTCGLVQPQVKKQVRGEKKPHGEFPE